MYYEVELKFPLEDPSRILSQLAELQAEPQAAVQQRDRYFNHPVRDFAQTDEALRIRSAGRENRITYKGPIVDALTKTRREIEIPFAEGGAAAEQLAEILSTLGFREVRAVEKRRVSYDLVWQGRTLELSFDNVTGLGPFVEIETAADETTRHEARDCILNLADHLGLQHSERRSYLSLLLEQDV